LTAALWQSQLHGRGAEFNGLTATKFPSLCSPLPQAQLERRQYPLATVGAAIVLAAEMNTVGGVLACWHAAFKQCSAASWSALLRSATMDGCCENATFVTSQSHCLVLVQHVVQPVVHTSRPPTHSFPLQVSLSLDHVSSSLQLMRRTLDRKLSQAQQRLVQLAGFLPYAASINTRNVGSHARTIIKLSALVGSTEQEAGGAGDGTEQLPAALEQQQQQHAGEGPAAAQQERVLQEPAAAAAAVPAAAIVEQQRPGRQQCEPSAFAAAQQQPDGAIGGQKRARDPGEAGSSAAAPVGKHGRTSGSLSQAATAPTPAAEAPSR